jgi:hypothetical protein
VVLRQSPVLRPPSSVLRPLSSVLCLLSFVFCLLSFVFCLLSSFIPLPAASPPPAGPFLHAVAETRLAGKRAPRWRASRRHLPGRAFLQDIQVMGGNVWDGRSATRSTPPGADSVPRRRPIPPEIGRVRSGTRSIRVLPRTGPRRSASSTSGGVLVPLGRRRPRPASTQDVRDPPLGEVQHPRLKGRPPDRTGSGEVPPRRSPSPAQHPRLDSVRRLSGEAPQEIAIDR